MNHDDTVRRVRSALAAEHRVDLAHRHVALALDDGVLTMEGELGDVGAKKLALERAAAVPGVHHIVDRLRVQRARSMTDPEIRDHLCGALLSEPAFKGCTLRAYAGRPRVTAALETGVSRCTLEAAVEDGVVTLSGEVPSLTHKRLAGVLAWWVPGTRDVVNGLEVTPPEDDSDDEITDAVRIVLEKDPLVEAGDVRVSTRARSVLLEGEVATPQQREAAEIDAWCVFGVDGVVDRIDVRASGGHATP